MRASGSILAAIVAWAAVAGADPKPTEIDSKAFRDKLELFQDAQGNTYAVLRDDGSVYWGKGTVLYEQWRTGASSDGERGTWEVSVWTPRLPNIHHGSIGRLADGTYKRDCDGLDDAVLTPVTGDKAKKLLASIKLMTPLTDRIPYLLARDDAGIYYYVDHLRHGGEGYRVFVGKRGAMKQTALSDVAIDSGGAVFATKTGDLRLVNSAPNNEGKRALKWVHGEKGTDLQVLDTDVESVLIFKTLGIYGVLGTLCDNA